MLSLFTEYLLQYKKVCIPDIGTFEIVQQTPVLNFTDKLFTPPVYITKYQEKEILSEHQVSFFAATNKQLGNEQLREELVSFGKKFRNSIKEHPYQWNGFGTLLIDSDTIIFEPLQIKLGSLQYIQAEKVMRGTADHSMIVGDKEMTLQEVSNVLQDSENKKPSYLLIGWIILALAIIAILIILYMGNFNSSSSGLKTTFDTF